MTKRPEKKSETIEVRVSYTEKLAFMEACKKAGTTASHAIRDYMNDFLSPHKAHPAHKRNLAIIIGAISLTAIIMALILTLPSTNEPTVTQRVMHYFDRNNDGFISLVDAETLDKEDQNSVRALIEIIDKNLDGRVNQTEMEALANITIEMRASQNTQVNSDAHRKILIIPDNLSEEERQKYLDRIKSNSEMSTQEQERLLRIIGALTKKRADDQNVTQ